MPVILGETANTSSEGKKVMLTLPWSSVQDAGQYTVKARYAESTAKLTIKGMWIVKFFLMDNCLLLTNIYFVRFIIFIYLKPRCPS